MTDAYDPNDDRVWVIFMTQGGILKLGRPQDVKAGQVVCWQREGDKWWRRTQ